MFTKEELIEIAKKGTYFKSDGFEVVFATSNGRFYRHRPPNFVGIQCFEIRKEADDVLPNEVIEVSQVPRKKGRKPNKK